MYKDLSIVAMMLTIALLLGTMIGVPSLDDTYSTCMHASTVMDKELTQQCGEMQEKTQHEFLCSTHGCWLEYNKEIGV